MATETLTLSGAGDEENIVNATHGIGQHWADCDAIDGDVVYDGLQVWHRDLYNCDNPVGIGAADTINSVRVYIYCKKITEHGGTSYCQESIKSGGVAANAGSNVVTTSYQWFSALWATPPEGGSWTLAKLIALQVGLRVYADLPDKIPEVVYCDKVQAVVDYTPAPVPRHGFVNFQVPGIV